MVKVHFCRDMCICPASLMLGTPPPPIEASGALLGAAKREREREICPALRAALEFWVKWHDYLKKMKLPSTKWRM